MGDELDISVDTSFETSSSDSFDSGGFDDSVDVGEFMDAPADVGDFSSDSSEIESLMDRPSDVGSIMDDSVEFTDFADQPSDVVDSLDSSSDIEMLMDEPADLGSSSDGFPNFTDYQPVVEGITDARSEVESFMDEPSDVARAMDGIGDIEPYHATPNSDISILQEDGSVDSLENIMAANEDTGVAPLDAESYHATPNSEIPILQEDGTVDTLENIMAASAETDDAPLDVEPYHAMSNSEIPILQEDGTVDSLGNINVDLEEPSLDSPDFENAQSDLADEGVADSLEAIMNDSAEIESSGLEELGTDISPAADASVGDVAPMNGDISIAGDDVADTGDAVEPIAEPIHIAQNDVESYVEDATDPERLQQIRDGIASGQIQIDADTELPDDDAIDEASGPVLVRDPNEQWEIGNNAINDTIEAIRDDLRDKGMEDGSEMEAIVMAERARLQEELAQDISGDFATPSQSAAFADPVQSETADFSPDTATVDQPVESLEPADEVADVPPEIDYDAVYSGLDSYDFDGIDVGSDVERLDSFLESFQPETWENLTVDEQKAAMSDLAGYVNDVIGFDNPPQIVYYNNPVAGDYGGYSPSTNTLEVNEYMLYESDEAADTVAHELWHAYQHERALNPQSAKDYQYQYGFDNYIRPDVDLTAYQDQLVEAEARAFAQQFKDRLSMKRRSI